jgi:murein DD-endopeptidase MepM/ murein hydrolase activator NlpD
MRNAAWILAILLSVRAWGATFVLPTANTSLLDPAKQEQFFVGTIGRPWTSGQFGCVRSEGFKFHEGLDIRCLARDRRGEPTDPVMASADGTVAYISTRAGLSNYGIYVVLRHQVEGLEIYTLYAHLSAVRKGLRIGDTVRAGEVVATMGRTTNTREGISKERAHLHFEIDLVANGRYAAWHASTLKGVRNDHGNFNGRNLLGIDPAAIFREQARLGAGFRLVQFLQSQPVLARVAVRGAQPAWVRRYPQLVVRNPVAEREGIAGYEFSLAFNGLPIRITPRSARELPGNGKVQLLDVNAAELAQHPCGKMVFKRGQVWTLLPKGQELIDLLTY